MPSFEFVPFVTSNLYLLICLIQLEAIKHGVSYTIFLHITGPKGILPYSSQSIKRQSEQKQHG